MEARHRSRRALDIPPKYDRPQGTRRQRNVVARYGQEDPQIAALRALQSQQIDDPFRDQVGVIAEVSGLRVLEPPFNMNALLRMPRENNMLRQCIDAMVTNVEGHGWRLEFVGQEGQEETPAAKAEKIALENLLDVPNDDHSLQELRERVRRDLEHTGNGYIEVGRDQRGRVTFVAHLPAHLVRLTVKDVEPVPVRVTMPREGEAAEQTVTKTFRRFVQLVGTRRVFFKEYGDPRPINPSTGRVDVGLPIEQQATEVVHLTQYAPGTPYGVPRWINQMPAILGSRQAELTNLDFFKENAIPAMALLVSGGMVTQSTIDEVEEQFKAVQGRRSMNRLLVIEAHGDEEAASQDGTIPAPRLELKPLQNDRQKDALFQTYDHNNMSKIRSAFRLPPIFVGLAQDYTHATAKTSFEVAESQVFGPERARMDDVWNSKVLGTYNPQFWAFRSLPPRISDPTDVISAVTSFNEVGALTPNVAIGLANDFFDLEIPSVEAAWGDLPFSLVESLVQQGFTLEGMDLVAEGIDEEMPPEMPPEDAGQQPPFEEDEDEERRAARAYNILREGLRNMRRALTRPDPSELPPRHRSRPVA